VVFLAVAFALGFAGAFVATLAEAFLVVLAETAFFEVSFFAVMIVSPSKKI
jgi:hypothetical protein